MSLNKDEGGKKEANTLSFIIFFCILYKEGFFKLKIDRLFECILYERIGQFFMFKMISPSLEIIQNSF